MRNEVLRIFDVMFLELDWKQPEIECCNTSCFRCKKNIFQWMEVQSQKTSFFSVPNWTWQKTNCSATPPLSSDLTWKTFRPLSLSVLSTTHKIYWYNYITTSKALLKWTFFKTIFKIFAKFLWNQPFVITGWVSKSVYSKLMFFYNIIDQFY